MEAYKIELEKQYLAKLLEKQKNKDNIEAPGKNNLDKNNVFDFFYIIKLFKLNLVKTS